MVVCHRKALSHITRSHCRELNRSSSPMCGDCEMHKHAARADEMEEQRERERRDECRKIGGSRKSS